MLGEVGIALGDRVSPMLRNEPRTIGFLGVIIWRAYLVQRTKERRMDKRLKVGVLSALAVSSLAIGLGIALGQQTPPTENKGVSAKQIGAMELGPEIEGMAGRQLRLRVVTLDAGGVFAVHSHKDRPTIEYVLKGNATEFKGGAAKE